MTTVFQTDLARFLVEGDEVAVELADVHLAFAERDAAREPAAADDADLRVEVCPVLPADLSGRDVDGEGVVLTRRHVDHPVVDERLRLR
jgi:hypothetical protein